MGISKSKYTLYRQCSKALWLKQNHPELAVVVPRMEARFFAGNLDGNVHNGSEAMNIYPMIAAISEDEQERARQSLLKYCELDTYAMVKVWEKLREIVL